MHFPCVPGCEHSTAKIQFPNFLDFSFYQLPSLLLLEENEVFRNFRTRLSTISFVTGELEQIVYVGEIHRSFPPEPRK